MGIKCAVRRKHGFLFFTLIGVSWVIPSSVRDSP